MIRKGIYMRDLIIYFGIGIMVAAIIVGAIVFIVCSKKEKKVQFYIQSFKDCFREKQDIRLTMLALIEKYKKNSKEAEALKAGLYYLDTSILQDYDSALEYIARLFDDDRVDAIHSQSILLVWKKRQGIMALPKKEESNMGGGE